MVASPHSAPREGLDPLPETFTPPPTWTRVPVTPTQALPWDKQIGRHANIAPDAPNTPPHGSTRTLRGLQTTSPYRAANISIRRSHHEDTLLQSPPRAGHAARMRQMFEEAGHEYTSAQDSGKISYPHLPNISEKVLISSPFDRQHRQLNPCNASDCRPESLCLPPSVDLTSPRPDQSYNNLSGRSESSSGSWSDDSGYFITASHSRLSGHLKAPSEQIHDWLRGVSTCGEDNVNEFAGTPDLDDLEKDEYASDQDYEDSSVCLSKRSQEEGTDFDFSRPLRGESFIEGTTQDCAFSGFNHSEAVGLSTSSSALTVRTNTNPHVIKRTDTDLSGAALPFSPSTPMHHTEAVDVVMKSPSKDSFPGDDDMELSPLSPNVCIERGPSRYHSNRRLNKASNPSPLRRWQNHKHQPSRLKENVTMSEEMAAESGSPYAWRSKLSNMKV